MKTKIIGFESANSFVKVYHDGKAEIYPNTVTPAVKENYKLHSNQVENVVYEIAGEKVNVGRTLNYTSSSTDSIKRYETKNYFIESIIALSHFCIDGDVVKAITGIPSNHYDSKDEAAKLIKGNLEGEHTIIRNGKSFTFTVKEVVVILQPLATFFYSVVDEWGNADEDMMNRFNDSETLVIDIGWGTTDIALILGSGLVDQWTINTSMKTAYEKLLSLIKYVNKDKNIATAKIQLLDLEKQVRENNSYSYSNHTYDVNDLKEKVFKDIAESILTEVSNIRGLDKYRTVIFTGGGTKALIEPLNDMLTNKATNKLEENVFIINEMQIANAKGYYVYGKYIQGE